MLCIKDVDVSKTPSLPPDQRDHHRRDRIRTQTQNEEIAERRWLLTMQAWTEVYTLLCVEDIDGAHCAGPEP